MGKKTKAGALYIREIPRDIKNEFKAYCNLHDISMTSAVIEIMRAPESVITQKMIAAARERDALEQAR